MDVIGYGSTAIGSVLETLSRIAFIRAAQGRQRQWQAPEFLDCEVIVLLAEEPFRAFGFELRADSDEPTQRGMFDLLRFAVITDRRNRLDYIKTAARAGKIIRVAKP